MTEEQEPAPSPQVGSTASESPGPLLIVGMGGQTGAAEAVREFFAALDEGAGMAFIVVEPAGSALDQLRDTLQASCGLSVRPFEDGEVLAPDRIYLLPRGHELHFDRGRVRLRALGEADAELQLDRFFHALAETFAARAVGVILSGSGTDGSLGIQHISNAGGMTLAQDPKLAVFDALPRSAIAGGAIDHVLGPGEMAQVLLAYVGTVAQDDDERSALRDSEAIVHVLGEVCELLERATNHNFKHYKTSTLVRRIRRRMHVLRLPTIEPYVERLRSDEEELAQLFRTLLIGVTSFFRDSEAFDALTRQVLRPLFQQRSTGQLRFWVPGCATGEEAYSLAIVARELMQEMQDPPELVIFATDIDERALSVARQGMYPAGIAEQISPERLERFFVRRGKSFHVKTEVRELCLFAPHNLINDPPFTRLDLISCRNLLIYFGPHLQQKLFPLFHYALRQNGVLFLGTSESVSAHKELFTQVDPKHRISRRKSMALRSPGLMSMALRGNPRPLELESGLDSEPDLHQLMQRILLDEFAPKSVIVGEDGKILCASGDMQHYLTVTAGTFQNSLVRLARPGLRVGLRAALNEAIRIRRKVVHDKGSVPIELGVQRVRITVQPMPRFGEEADLFLVVFEAIGPLLSREDFGGENADDVQGLIEQLETELTSTRGDLEKTIRELETANEDLKSSNEELLSMNEELQSANEELETSKEEVQQAHQALARAHANLSNLLTSTQIATIFLDQALRIQSFTPAVTDVYNLLQSDVGRPLSHITHRARHMPPLPRDGELDPAVGVQEDEVVLENGKHFLRRTSEYRSHEGKPEGLVVTFVDVSALKQAEEEGRRHQRQLQIMTDALPVLIAYVDADMRYRFNNQAYERWFGVAPEALYGKHMRELTGDEAFRRAEVWLQRVLAGETVDQVSRLPFARGGERSVRAQYVPDIAADGQVRGFFAVVHDISERESAAAALEAAKREAERASRAKSEFLANMSHEIRTPISAILGFTELLTNHVQDPDNLASIQAIKRNGQYLVEIINDILDLSKIEARMLRAERIRVAPHQLLREAVEALSVRARERGLHLALQFDSQLPETIESDPTRFRQILLNLIGNAIKFTNQGGVEVRARLLPGELLEIGVIDTGIGMTVEQQQRLFEPFTQGDSSVTRQYGGTGLGLAISKRLIELLGGNILVDSTLGAGSTFRFTVRTGSLAGVRLVDAAPLHSEPPVRAARRLTGYRVLVVDDRPDMRYLVQTYLEEAEAEVMAVGDGEAALRRVESAAKSGEPFQVVLLDMQMPGMDGYAVARGLRDRGVTARIVAVTANAMKGDRELCLAAGCDDYLAKPVDRVDLINAVAQAQHDAVDEQQATAAPAEPAAEPAGREPAASARRVLLVDDSEDSTYVLSQLLELRGFEVHTAQTGGEALELAERAPPDVAVVDLGLPDIDGFEVVARMRRIPALAALRIIALTGRSLDGERQRIREAGFDAHLVKPADIDKLVEALRGG